MNILFVPLYRLATSYVVSVGRRWSVLEQLLLIELSIRRGTTAELAEKTAVPGRLVMEALINLLRAGWIEVRATDKGAVFTATPIGKVRAADEILPDQTQRAIRYTSLCVERLTGTWIRADELDVVYENDLPLNAACLDAKVHTFSMLDGDVRSLLTLQSDEGLEPVEPSFQNLSKPYARIAVSLDRIEGIPARAPLALKRIILDAADIFGDATKHEVAISEAKDQSPLHDDIGPNEVIVGGPAHRALVESALRSAHSHVVIHSCFIDPQALRGLLPLFEEAARRGVYVDLLWGLREKTETSGDIAPIAHSQKVLASLSETARSRVQLSPISSGSHAKILMYDDRQTGEWLTCIGSCNFLSSLFTSIELSIVARSQRLAVRILGNLIAAQLPASGSWSPTARRLNRLWDRVRTLVSAEPEVGSHSLTLLSDRDHYACVTTARDLAKREIDIGCDLFGLAAKTSVLVPMGRAVELGRKVRLYYHRPSKFLDNTTWDDELSRILPQGIDVSRIPNLHGKFLLWDDDNLAITSFNWLATVATETRWRGAEFGLLATGPGLRTILSEKLRALGLDLSN